MTDGVTGGAVPDPVPFGPAAVDAAVAALAAGLVVVVPTDTVYGVAVDPTVSGATDRLFAVKRRPRSTPLAVLVDSVEAAATVAALPPAAADLAARFWPGPLTLVVPRRPGWPGDLGDETATVGVRLPDHPLLRSLLAVTGPLATTSANLHGLDTPADAPGVARQLGAGVALVLDGGPCAGAPSTVVDCTGDRPRPLRIGRLPWSDIDPETPGRP